MLPATTDDFDPALKEAMEEIKIVLKKYDCGAAVTLVSKTHSEYLNYFPTWSVAQLYGPVGLRIKCKREDFESFTEQQEAMESSCHLILQLRDIGAQTFLMMDHVRRQIEAFVDIEHKPFFQPSKSAKAEESFRERLFEIYFKPK